MKRIERKTTLEMLWPYVLRMLNDRPMYVYELRKAIAKKFGFSFQLSAAYKVLSKLQREGLVVAEWKHESRPRKYYHITPKGRELLNQFKIYLSSLEEKFR